MLNRYGVCESAFRRAESLRQCPHDVIRRAVEQEKNKKK